ncbi:MAG: GNAT family N-acetyltransferase [Jatrophihabitantaceae bacterium]
MLELARGLRPADLRALAALERRCVEADGGRLKLEWGVLNSRSGELEGLLWREGDRLVGFLGLYAFGAPAVELVGMVDPAARRRGIATALLDAARALCRDRGYEQVLLVVSRSSTAGRALALRRGAQLEHSEHALVLTEPPDNGPADPQVGVRPATPADAAILSRLLTKALGHPHDVTTERSAPDSERRLVVELAGDVVGTVRVSHDPDGAGVYGFAVDPRVQGRGIGRDVLRRVCGELFRDGAGRVGLEVAVDNDRALGLYTSIGFVRVTTEDYYALP